MFGKNEELTGNCRSIDLERNMASGVPRFEEKRSIMNRICQTVGTNGRRAAVLATVLAWMIFTIGTAHGNERHGINPPGNRENPGYAGQAPGNSEWGLGIAEKGSGNAGQRGNSEWGRSNAERRGPAGRPGYVPATYTVTFQTDSTVGSYLKVDGQNEGGEFIESGIAHDADSSAVEAVAPASSRFVDWTLDGTAFSTDNPLTVEGVVADMTLVANFVEIEYTLTYTAGPNGSIAGTSPQTVAHGGSGTAVTANPASGYRFDTWSDNATANPRTDSNVTGDITVTALFELEPEPDPDPPSSEDVIWTDLINCAANGNTVSKTGTAEAWDAGAFSTQKITGDGGFSCTVSQGTDRARIVGLSVENRGVGGFSIDYSFYVKRNNWVNLRAGGTRVLLNAFNVGVGDTLALEREGTTIKYFHNGSLIYTAADVTSANLFVDVALYHPGTEISNAVIY